jgi:tetratricopeptide (TPR) repeat protein
VVAGRWRRRIIAVTVVVAAGLAGGIGAVALGGSHRSQQQQQSLRAAGAPPVASATDGDAVSTGIAQAQAQLRTEPGNWDAWATLGMLYVQEGRITADPTYYPKAQQALDRSLAIRLDQNYLAMTGLASLAAARHDFAGALDWSRRAQAIDPQSATVLAVMTDALDELGRYDEAMRTVQRAVLLRPGVDTFARVSYVEELHGQLAAAIQSMQRAREDAFSPSDIGFTDYYLGQLYFGMGNLSAASGYFSAGLAADSSYAPLYEGRAKVEAARGQVDAAVADYTAAVDRFPTPEYVVEFGDYLTSLGRKGDAQHQYELVAVEDQLFKSNGVNQDLEITIFQAEHGQPAAAVAAGRAEWSRRHSIIVADALGWALHAAGRDSEALGYAKFATSLGYRNAAYYFHLGMIERSLGQLAAAKADLARALGINPYFSALHAAQAKAALHSLAVSS